jgi:hypothetical protein
MINALTNIAGTVIVQLNTPPDRAGGDQPSLLQASAYDSAGDLYCYDKGLICRVADRLVFPRVTGAILASLRTFLEVTAAGVRNEFLWWDHLAASHTVRFVSPELTHQQVGPDRHRVEFGIEEDLALTIPAVANWDTAKNAKTGAAPVWILKITVNAVDYYLSDSAFTLTGWGGQNITTRAWIKGWGAVQAGATNGLREYRVSSFSADVLVDPDAATSIKTLADTYELEQNPAILYLWFHGLNPVTDPPREKWRGHIVDHPQPDETTISLEMEDESSRLKKQIGTLLDSETYPNADPQAVGKLIPIPYGVVKRLPALGADVGIRTTLALPISAASSTLIFSSADKFSPGMTVAIDDEELRIDTIVGDTVTVARGVNSTLPAEHSQGAVIWERRTEYVYLASAVAIAAINRVYAIMGEAIEVNIASLCTLYTGQPGSEHPSGRYPGMAVVSVPGLITAAQLAGLALVDGIGVVDSILVNDTINVSDTIGVSDSIGVSDTIATDAQLQYCSIDLDNYSYTGTVEYAIAIINGNLNDGCKMWLSSSITLQKVKLISATGQTKRVRVCVQAGSSTSSGSTSFNLYVNGTLKGSISAGGSSPDTFRSSWFTLAAWSDLNADNTYVRATVASSGSTVWVWEVWLEVEYDPSAASVATPGVAKTGSATKTGSAVKTGLAAKTGGASKSGSASKSGTVWLSGNNSFTIVSNGILVDLTRDVYTPAAVIGDILTRYFTDSTLTQVGTFPASYRFDGAINEQQDGRYWLDYLAFQARAWFCREKGVSRLIVRPDTPTPVKTISACKLNGDRRSHSITKVALTDVINRINLRYDRDWSMQAGNDAYQGLISGGAAGESVAYYGEQGQDELFRFDFVTSPDMAVSVKNYYLSRHGRRCRQHTVELFLDNEELGFADCVTVNLEGTPVNCLVIAPEIQPGDKSRIDTITVIALDQFREWPYLGADYVGTDYVQT